MEIKSKLNKCVLHSQTREVISNVFKYMQEEKTSGVLKIPLDRLYERVIAATGVSERSIRRIVIEKSEINAGTRSSFTSPKKNKKKTKPKTDLDDADKGVLRRTILNTFTVDKIVPTMPNILRKFKETGYTGGIDSLRKVVKDMGFRWRKTKTNRKLLMEKHDIRQLRVSYLRTIQSYRNEKRPIIYMDETYIHSSHTVATCWSDNSNEGLARPISKGLRLIIVHAGCETGFIPNAKLIFKSNTTTGDYHHEMNYENYKKWLLEKLIPNLPPKSVLVIDNAPYHNVQKDKAPNSNSRKSVMIDWLRSKNIYFDNNMLKPDLYNIIKVHKPTFKTYEIDEMLTQRGHSVLRLPPYHPDLNPIELVWASLKQYVAKKNLSFTITYVQQLCDNFFDEFSAAEWKKCCDHAIKWEQKFLEAEPLIDEITDQFIINLGEDSESESEEEVSDSDSA